MIRGDFVIVAAVIVITVIVCIVAVVLDGNE